jgi:hypothetical protein
MVAPLGNLCRHPPPKIPAPAKQGSPHNWKFLKVRTGPRAAHSFQLSAFIQLYNKIVQALSRTHNKIIKMKNFAANDNAKPNIDNISGLNLVAVKLTNVQVIKLPL